MYRKAGNNVEPSLNIKYLNDIVGNTVTIATNVISVNTGSSNRMDKLSGNQAQLNSVKFLTYLMQSSNL